jgi:hypothetical protein
MDSLKKLLWSHLPRFQLWGAGVGACLGLLLVLAAVQVSIDFRKILQPNAEGNQQFLQINKRVSFLNTLAGASTFSEEEVEEWEDQPYVRSVGAFTSNNFRVSAASPSLGFYTELFFEAVPDRYLDVESPGFRWREGEDELPIVLSRDYLALYNFGFAPAQGLPQFSPGTIRKVKFDIYLGTGANRKRFTGRIVGFSDRFNSILVPQSFMDWANQNWGDGTSKAPSRLLLEVTDPNHPDLRKALESNNLEVSSGQMIGQQVVSLFRLSTGLLILVGLIILLLSFFIFFLNFRLLVARSRLEIRRLLELGYTTQVLSGVLSRKMGVFYIWIGAIALLGIIFLHILLAKWMATQGFEIRKRIHWLPLLLGIIIPMVVYVLTTMGIRRNVEGEL